MRALHRLQAICKAPENKKKVTFQDISPEPRVTDAEPRVANAEPRVIGAPSAFRTIPPQTRTPKVATAVIDKPINAGPAGNTRSQRRTLLRQAIRAQIARRTNQGFEQDTIELANLAILDENGKPISYRRLMKNPETRKIWSPSAANEFGRLAQGVGGCIEGTNTIFFVAKR